MLAHVSLEVHHKVLHHNQGHLVQGDGGLARVQDHGGLFLGDGAGVLGLDGDGLDLIQDDDVR